MLLLFGHKTPGSRDGEILYCGNSGTERLAAGAAAAGTGEFAKFTAVDHPQTYPFSTSRFTGQGTTPPPNPEPAAPATDSAPAEITAGDPALPEIPATAPEEEYLTTLGDPFSPADSADPKPSKHGKGKSAA